MNTISETVICPYCGVETTVKVEAKGYFAWKNGESILKALPNIDTFTRKVLVSKLCKDCQKISFKDFF